MYISHWHHTSNRSSSSTYYTYLYACTFLCNFLFFEIGLCPLICTLSSESWMKVNDACHHCSTNKLLTIYLQPLQKIQEQKKKRETQEIISVKSQNTVENTALIHRLFSQSVVSETDQCDQCDSVIEEEENNNKKFHNWISNRSDWQPWKKSSYVNFPTGVKEIKKTHLQSLPRSMARYGGKLDAGVSDLQTASAELMSVTGEFWGGIYQHDSRGRKHLRHCNRWEQNGKDMLGFILYWVLIYYKNTGGSFLNKAFHSTIAWFKTALETRWFVTGNNHTQRNVCNHCIVRRFGHSQKNVVQVGKRSQIWISGCFYSEGRYGFL